MKEKVIILHWRQSYDKTKERWPMNTRSWLGWLKKELEIRGFEVYNPLIKNDWEVKYENWKKTIEDLNISIDENTILVWTSAWAWFWVRYLWETKKKIKLLILVAPAKKPSIEKANEFDFKSGFWDFKVDESITNRVEEVFILTSDDEDETLRKDAYMYRDKLNWKILELTWRWHFTSSHSKINDKLKEVLDYIISKSGKY